MSEAAAQSGMALSRVNLREAFVVPDSMERFIGDLARLSVTPIAQAESLTAAEVQTIEHSYGFGPQPDDRRKPFIYSDGVAVVAVHGSLVNRLPYSWGFVTGYQAIRRQINAIKADKAANPDDVQMVIFDHDSPGGESAGCQELAAEIAALDEIVPCIAIVDSLCCSASFMLAVPCRKVYAIPSATVGSIGVYKLHVDLSGAYSQAGIKFTYVQSGAHKTDGNPYNPLDPQVEAKWQADVDKSRVNFAQFVADHTGLSLEAVMETEAQTYKADEALAINLISGVMTPSEAVSTFLSELADDETDPEDGDEEMKTPGQEATSGLPSTAAAPAPAIDPTVLAAAVSQGVAAAMTAMRTRGSTVRQHDAAKANPNLANHLLDNTEMDAASIISTLEAAGPAAPAAKTDDKPQGQGGGNSQQSGGAVDTTNHLDNAMRGQRQPNVGAGSENEQGDGGTGERTDADVTGDLVASYAAATGRKLVAVK